MRVPPSFPAATFVEVLRWRAEHQANETAYTFLLDGEREEATLTHAELDAQARALAAVLRERGGEGERALLLYPPGLDYVVAFFGCLYAGTTAVPIYPPRIGRPNPRLAAVVDDARPAFVLTPDFIRAHESSVVEQNPELGRVTWLAPDADVPAGAEDGWRDPGARPGDLAFLQYTSGSTASPKGVMVSHGNLIANVGAAYEPFDYAAETVGVMWTPPYHDMGLIGGVLHPMHAGFPIVLMSPIAFLQRPARWLEAMTRHRGTLTGAPSSAYQQCVDRIGEEERAGLDLSPWTRAINGAEPVRADVLDRFTEAFAPCGFRRSTFYPCFGMAEATLLVSGARSAEEPVVWEVDRGALAAGRAETAAPGDPDPYRLAASGAAVPTVEIVIADAETCERRPDGIVGEIWLAGPSVALGYWGRPEETERTFGARLAGSGEGPFLRTGDLGVLRDGSLFVTGRHSDLMIVRGRNVYPQDVEATVERAHPALDANRGASFAVEADGEERVVVVHELPRDPTGIDVEEVAGAVRQAVAEEHALQPHAVVLIRSRTIPRTSSGKIQRRPCRARFLEGSLDVVYEWRADGRASSRGAPEAATPVARDEAAIRAWLQTEIAQRLGLGPAAVDVGQPFSYYGLDSVQAVTIAAGLAEWLGRDVEPTLAWDHPTIEAAARFLAAGETAPAAHAVPAAGRRGDTSEAIAVVGLACRFPAADTPEAFWELLRSSGDAVTEVPADRWDLDELYDADPDAPGRTYSRHGGFLDDVAGFDAGFFGVSPREATAMDPQQRLLLEVSWEALERAGIAPDRLAGTRAGTFVGISTSDYALLQAASGGGSDVYAGTGSAHSIAANRLSYVLGLEGPSMAVDTACSSSLVAVHLASASLRAGESDVALAGGVNLMLSPEATVAFSKARMLSRSGRCRTFDEHADGYVRGEGCGVVVLKRLSDAVAAGDRVHAVIRGSAVNQDGRSNGLTAPHGPSQEAVIREALAAAGVQPGEVAYVEAHGTGTPLGDPIELRALARALGAGRERPLLVGSVKTNVGHLEAAAGIAGLMKAVLAVEHGEVPAHLHLAEPNRHVPWDAMALRVATEPVALPEEGRIAGVSSFGFGGTNAHVVVEAAPAVDPAPAPGDLAAGPALVKLAARGEAALRETAARLRVVAERERETAPAAIAHAAGGGRADLPDRAAVVAATREELLAGLDAVAAGADAPGLVVRGAVPAGGAPKVAFLVAGQGTRYGGALRELDASSAPVRRMVDRLAGVLGGRDAPALAALLEPGEDADRALARTEVAQPALYALALALAAWWSNAGVRPAAIVGHSVGAYAAATLAGVLSPEEGARLVAARGRLMGELPAGGGMAAVLADAATVASALERHPDVAIACLNATDETVVAGPRAALDALCTELAAAGVRSRALAVSHAFHSALVEPCLPALERELREVALDGPRVPLVSDTTGAVVTSEVADPRYWLRHARERVAFADALRTVASLGCGLLVELGPGSTLLGLARRCPETAAADALPSLPHPLRSLGAAWAGGARVDWAKAAPPAGRRVDLPTYPFQRTRHWIAARPPAARPAGAGLRPRRVETPLPQAIFEAELGIDLVPFLGDHRVHGRAVVPAVALLAVMVAAAREAGEANPGIRSLALVAPLVLPETGARTVQVVVDGDRASLHGRGDDGAWRLHAEGTIEPAAVGAAQGDGEPGADDDELEPDAFYRALREHGLDFGPSFQAIRELRRGADGAWSRLALPAQAAATNGHHAVHPVLLDAGFQTLGALLGGAGDGGVFVPAGIERFGANGGGEATACRATLRPEGPGGDAVTGDVRLFDAAGTLVAEMSGVQLRRITAEALGAATPGGPDRWLYTVQWRERERRAAVPADPGAWLVAGDGAGPLADGLRARGASVLATRDDESAAAALAGGPPPRGVVWSGSAEGALRVTQALAGVAPPPRLYLVTRGAQPAGGPVASPLEASLWGLGRVVAQEHPALRCTRIDVDAAEDVDALAAELLAGDDADEVALRGGRRLVSRLARTTLPPSRGAESERPVALGIARKGTLEDLRLEPVDDVAPGPGQVKIRVHAAGLNFRDVLNALGVYPGDAGPLGGECAGTVAAVGDGVDDLACGDAVVAIAPASFATYAVTDARLTARMPRRLSFEEAAAVPIAFLTAAHALEVLAAIGPGRRVLVHAATGGVGMAALQLCRRAGADVLATAGSPRKRRHLETLGVRHVMDSRSLAFAGEVLEATGGEGVDVVLNSLAGEFVAKSLSVLRPGGCFVEIGKADILDPERVAALEPPVRYHAFDLAQMCDADPAAVGARLRTLCASLDAGELEPLPIRAFDLAQAPLAFRHMAQARHIGKVVLAAPEAIVRGERGLDPQATYLVTGGLGALGRIAARRLIDSGARSVVLAGRSAEAADDGAPLGPDLPEGVEVLVRRCDVSREEDVAALVAGLERPLRGIVHAAGVLDDAMVAGQTPERLAAVMAPKAAGARILHELTREHELDFFVLFSSASAVLGSPGQANYAAANACLDALAHQRRAAGLAATSIAWGPWDGLGMAAGAGDSASRVRARGIDAISPEQGANLLARALGEAPAHVVVLPVDWAALGRALPSGAVPPLLEDFVAAQGAEAAAGRDRLVAELRALAPGRRRDALVERLTRQAATVLGLDPRAAVDPARPLAELGLDSLTGVELANVVGRMTGVALPATALFDHPTLDALAQHLLDQLVPANGANGAAGAERERALDHVEALSDAEVQARVERSVTALLARDGGTA